MIFLILSLSKDEESHAGPFAPKITANFPRRPAS
jgi:hypothetical protein